jgi:hypothetical protein
MALSGQLFRKTAPLMYSKLSDDVVKILQF